MIVFFFPDASGNKSYFPQNIQLLRGLTRLPVFMLLTIILFGHFFSQREFFLHAIPLFSRH